MSETLERYEVRDLKFDVRPDTSDKKAIDEVVKRRGYSRHGFEPASGEHWLDLGGNIGAYSVWAASFGCTVDVYEPDPEMCELIEHNVALNGFSRQVAIYQAAVVSDGRKKTAVLSKNSARGNLWRSSIEKEWRGGESIAVSTLSINKIWSPDAWVKMDIEGSEMAILEFLIAGKMRAQGMVFEWSFDIDRSVPRFQRVITGLREIYENVEYPRFDETVLEWPASWFPPCKLVWCW